MVKRMAPPLADPLNCLEFYVATSLCPSRIALCPLFKSLNIFLFEVALTIFNMHRCSKILP